MSHPGPPPIANPPAKRRLFFALWPEQTVCKQLMEWQSLIALGQTVAPERLHITLAFLGDVDNSQYAQLVWRASAIQSSQFELTRMLHQ